MNTQMTIFELLAPQDLPWQNMTNEQIADKIASKFGVVASFDEHRRIWRFSLKGYDITVEKGNYAEGVYDGKEMIRVHGMNRTSGWGSPCDSIEEAVQSIEYGTR